MITTGTINPNEHAPRYKVISPPTVKANIDHIYKIDNENLKKELANQPYICTAADIWSTRHRSYMGVSVCYLNEDLEPISKILCCRRFKSPHTNDRISELLHSINKEFGIERTTIACVTDNAANFVKSFRQCGITINDFTAIQNAEEVQIDEFDDLCEEVYLVNF